MGDRYQTAVDLEADAESAPAIAVRLRNWMIEREIIAAEQTDCTLGKPLGHAPGKNYTLAVVEPWELLFQLRTNGVSFIVERSVFYAAGIGEVFMVCGSCGARSKLNDAWSAAVDEWYGRKGPGIVSCPSCGIALPITEWQHDPPWAFAEVGVKFWNWPRLREDFVKSLSELVGHRFRLVYGKL